MIKTQLLEFLEKTEKPISVSEILSKINANKTTIYRDIYQFLENQVITEVDFGDGKKRYELSSHGHHHHLVCKNCGKIEDLQINEKDLLLKIETETKFKIESHSLEFFGLCIDCK